MEDNFIKNIANKQLVTAGEQINKAMAERVIDTLSTMKADIARNSYMEEGNTGPKYKIGPTKDKPDDKADKDTDEETNKE